MTDTTNTQTREEWLASLKPGDKVAWRRGDTIAQCTVEVFTNTEAVWLGTQLSYCFSRETGENANGTATIFPMDAPEVAPFFEKRKRDTKITRVFNALSREAEKVAESSWDDRSVNGDVATTNLSRLTRALAVLKGEE